MSKMLKAKMLIATDKSYGVHPIEGILQIHFDQLNVIAKHLCAHDNKKYPQNKKY